MVYTVVSNPQSYAARPDSFVFTALHDVLTIVSPSPHEKSGAEEKGYESYTGRELVERLAATAYLAGR